MRGWEWQRASLPSLSPEDSAVRDALALALSESGGNVTEAARKLGKARQQAQRWLRRFGMDPLDFRKPAAKEDPS